MRKRPSPLTARIRRPEGMLALGWELGKRAFPGAVIGLVGPLGAGKTTLVRGIAEGMGLSGEYVVSSPTFTLLQVYPCREMELYHLDLYRVGHGEDLESTGYREALANGMLVAEWADRVPEILPPERLVIRLDYLHGGKQAEGRDVRFEPLGNGYRTMAEEAAKAVKRWE